MQAQIFSFIVPLIALIFTGVFFALWWKERSQKHVLAFASSFTAISIGVAFNIWIFDGITPLGIVTYHVLSMASVIALMWGTTHRLAQSAPIGASCVATVLTSIILWHATSVQAIDAMKMAQNVTSALMFTMMGVSLWFAKSQKLMDRAVIWICSCFAGFGFVKPMLIIFARQYFGDTAATNNILMSVHILVLALLLTLLALCLVAIVVLDSWASERDEAAEDFLSGLSNRQAFLESANAMLAKAQAESKLASLIIADIDHFKKVNDTWGHAAGDKVIAEFGKLIKHDVRPGDIAGRIGGEEFCILAWNCDAQQAIALADRIRLATQQLRVRQGGKAIEVSASFGVALWNERNSYDQLFERADAALYDAKKSGRNRVCVALEEDCSTGELSETASAEPTVNNVVTLNASKA